MAAECKNGDYPEEIDEQLTSFDSSVSSVKMMLGKLMSIPRNEQQQQKVAFSLKTKCQHAPIRNRFTDILIWPQMMELYCHSHIRVLYWQKV